MEGGPTISGFMIVRDAERQGYPFIEAASSALAACDELLIADGYSADRTWEGLLVLRERFGERVKLFRDRWPSAENRGGILAHMTNRVRRRCRGDYCLSVQANEIIDASAAPTLAALPRRHPELEMFALHYPVLLGPHLVWTEAWRLRLFRNIPDIVAIGDAYDVCNVLPRRSPANRAALPRPVHHYRAACPFNYVEKLRSVVPRTELWARELRLAEAALASAEREGDSIEGFWDRVQGILEVGLREGHPPDAELPTTPRCVGRTEHVPDVMRCALASWRYSLDDSLAQLTAAAPAP